MTLRRGSKWILGVAVVGTMAVTAVGNAALAREKMSKEDVLAKYERTGELEHCIGLQLIRQTRILDDQTILIEVSNRTAYLNELPQKCPLLKSMDAYLHQTSINQMCDLDLITVIDTTTGHQLGSCMLGKFERLTEKPKED